VIFTLRGWQENQDCKWRTKNEKGDFIEMRVNRIYGDLYDDAGLNGNQCKALQNFEVNESPQKFLCQK